MEIKLNDSIIISTHEEEGNTKEVFFFRTDGELVRVENTELYIVHFGEKPATE